MTKEMNQQLKAFAVKSQGLEFKTKHPNNKSGILQMPVTTVSGDPASLSDLYAPCTNTYTERERQRQRKTETETETEREIFNIKL